MADDLEALYGGCERARDFGGPSSQGSPTHSSRRISNDICRLIVNNRQINSCAFMKIDPDESWPSGIRTRHLGVGNLPCGD